MSAEYIMAGGNSNVILCERGIRTFETATRNTLDLSAVPIIHEKTHLPIVVDPSHATGKANLVEPMMIAAVAAGADGIMIHSRKKTPDEIFEFCDKFRAENTTTPIIVVPTSYNATTEATASIW